MHVLVQKGDELGRLNNLEAEIHGVRYAFVVAMARRVQFHVLGQLLHLFGGPRLVRQLAALHDSGLRLAAQEESARVRKNRIRRAAGPRLPNPLNIRLAVRGAWRRIWRGFWPMARTGQAMPQPAACDVVAGSPFATGYGRTNSKISPFGAGTIGRMDGAPVVSLRAFLLPQFKVRLVIAMQRHVDFPRPAVGLRILDGGFVADGVRTRRACNARPRAAHRCGYAAPNPARSCRSNPSHRPPACRPPNGPPNRPSQNRSRPDAGAGWWSRTRSSCRYSYMKITTPGRCRI